MKKFLLKDFTRGWVVGDFDKSIIRTKEFEFAVQQYQKGEKHPKHIHKIAREITVIVSGKFLLNGEEVKEGDVFLIEPNDPADFECLESGSTAVIKTPSVIGDKYLVD